MRQIKRTPRRAGEHGTFILYQPFLQALHKQMCRARGEGAPAPPLPVAQQRPPSALLGAHQKQGHAAAASAHMERPMRPGTALSTMPAAQLSIADREPYPYFEQQDHLPHNRRECDTFNRFHFGRLRASRGERALTPKVGQEPLTRYEAEYAKQVQRNRSPSPTQVRSAAPLGWVLASLSRQL